MVILPWLALIASVLFGAGIILALRAAASKTLVTLLGAALGVPLVATVAYATSGLMPLTKFTWWVIAIALLISAAGLWWQNRHSWLRLPTDWTALIVLITTAILALLIAPNLFFVDDWGAQTKVLNAWGDLGWHVSNITMLADSPTVPPPNPILAGHPLIYPFLINFVSGQLLLMGASLTASIVVPAAIFIPITFTLFFAFARLVTRNKQAAIIAAILFALWGSTLGWTRLGKDYADSKDSSVQFLLNLPRDYTGSAGDASGYRFPSIVTAALLPQRSFLLGLPLALTIIILLITGMKRQDTLPFIGAGIAAGLLPLSHAHSVLALVPAILILTALHFRQKGRRIAIQWSVFATLALAIGLPGILYIASAGSQDSFFRYQPGWAAGDINWFMFWLKNSGLILPLVIIALISNTPKLARVLAVAGILLFAASNIFSFAPWPWDNYKLLVYWLVFTIPVASWLMIRLTLKNKWWWAIVILFIAIHTLSTSLELWRLALPSAPVWGEWEHDAIEFARQVQGYTRNTDVILTAPYHNNPIALTGRSVYLGFPGHAWSHGYDYSQREQAVGSFYEGTISTLPELSPGYVTVGPIERQRYPHLTVRPEWRIITQTEKYILYKLP